MFKTLIGVALTVCCLLIRDGQTQSCSKVNNMVTCFPEIGKYMDRPVNLTMVIRAVGGDQGAAQRCQQFNQFTSCLDEKMRNCREVTDARQQLVVFWDNGRVGVDYMCNKHASDFAKHRTCLSSDQVRQAFTACDIAETHARRKRHTCDDYNKEIQCSDAVVTKHCGAEIAKHVGQVARIFLKNTAHTKDCTAPAFTSAAGSILSAPFMVSVCLAAAKLL